MENNILVIGIAGGTGSGKTTLMKNLTAKFGDVVTVLSHDNYYKRHDELSYEQRCQLNYDEPDALETDLMARHLDKLRRGEAVSTATLGEALSGEEMSLLVSLLQKPELLSRSGQSLRDYIGKIREYRDEAGQADDLRALANRYREKKGYEG